MTVKLSRYLSLSYVNLTRRKGGAALFILTLTLTLAALMTTLSLTEGWGTTTNATILTILPTGACLLSIMEPGIPTRSGWLW